MIKAENFDMPFNESPQEECGVFGIYKNDEELNVTEETYKALYTLQHRGQEARESPSTTAVSLLRQGFGNRAGGAAGKGGSLARQW